MQAFLHYVSLFALSGIGPVVCLSALLIPRSFWSFSALALALGAIFFNLTVLSFGHLGAELRGANLCWIACGTVSISLLAALIACVRRKAKISLSAGALAGVARKEIAKIDLPAVLVLGGYILFLFWVCTVHFFPGWDTFTYWLIDAQEIFNTGRLRTDSGVTNLFLSTSYHPLHAFYIFEWYGEPKEQWASLFPIMYAGLSTFFAYSAFGRPAGLSRFWLILALIWVLFSVQSWAFTFYADVHVAFFFTLFFYVLLRQAHPQFLGQRVSLLLFILAGLSCIKSANYVYASVLLCVWAVYDWPIIRKRGWRLAEDNFVIAAAILLAAGYAARRYYLSEVWPSKIVPEPLLEPSKLNFPLYNRLLHGEAEVDLVTSEYSVIYLIYLGCVFDLLLRSAMTRKRVLIVGCAFLFPFLNILEYMYSLNSLQSKSLTRYVITVFWVIPMYLALPQPWMQPAWIKRVLTWTVAGLTALAVGTYDYNQYILPAGPAHSGAFKDFKFHQEDYAISRRVLDRIGGGSVLLASNVDNVFIGNMELSCLQLRYYLAKNVIGGMYNVAKGEFRKKLRHLKPEFVLVVVWNDELIKLFNPANPAKIGLFQKISSTPLHWAEVSF